MDTVVDINASNHQVEIFVIPPLVKHPDADRLSLIKIPETDFVYVAATKDWEQNPGKLAIWIQPDSLVDTTRPEFAFLGKGNNRVRAKKLRGIVSSGILILAPEGVKLGDDPMAITKALGVTHYQPEEASKNAKAFNVTSGEATAPPKGHYFHYDVANFLKYGRKVFMTGEPVFITEKLHGENSRFVFRDGQMHCGSRNEWKKEFTTPPMLTLEDLIKKVGNEEKAKQIYQRTVVDFVPKKSHWWTILDTVPALRKFCEANPGSCVYGEVFGRNAKFRYGSSDDKLMFRAFDILVPSETGPKWMDADKFFQTCQQFEIPHVPILAETPFDFEKAIELAEGNTTFAPHDHIREGCVVKPKSERWDPALGRVSLKIINPKFLETN